MVRHERLSNSIIREPLRRSKTSCATENAAAEIKIDGHERGRVRPEGEPRDFSADGCWVRPYFS